MNKKIFSTASTKQIVLNEAGGLAFEPSIEHQLAQLVCVGTFNNTFYTKGIDVLEKVIELSKRCRVEFLAKLAVYSRQKAFMKDSPAVLLAIILKRDSNTFKRVFNDIVDDFKMLQNFVKVVRSGKLGYRSFGRVAKNAVNQWLNSRDSFSLMNSYGDPSMNDILKMFHAKPMNQERNNVYSYLLGKEYKVESLPIEFQKYIKLKKNQEKEIDGENKLPKISFQILTSEKLNDSQWKELACKAKFNEARQNLNAYQRHNVFEDEECVNKIAENLKDFSEITKRKILPFSIHTSYRNSLKNDHPSIIRRTLSEAIDVSLKNVTDFKQKVSILIDKSGSMNTPYSGATSNPSEVTCFDVALLFASIMLKRNSEKTDIIFYNTEAKKIIVDPDNSIVSLFQLMKNGNEPRGGTNCSSAISYMEDNNINSDIVIMISDNESWAQEKTIDTYLKKYLKNNKNSKLVCWDITPNCSVPILDNQNVMNIGGFTDSVFSIIEDFIKDHGKNNFWSKKIMKEYEE